MDPKSLLARKAIGDGEDAPAADQRAAGQGPGLNTSSDPAETSSALVSGHAAHVRAGAKPPMLKRDLPKTRPQVAIIIKPMLQSIHNEDGTGTALADPEGLSNH